MKYLCLIHRDENVIAALSEAEITALEEEHLAYDDELRKCGHFIAAEALQNGHDSTIVKIRNGKMIVTDGPFPESKAFLAGYWIIDVESSEEAYKLAARASAAPGPGGKPGNIPIEVRQIMSGPPEDV